MKKKIYGILICLGAMLMSFSTYAATDVYVDGEKLPLENEAFIENDSTLIPMREIFEALGSRVEWVESERAVMVYDGLTVMCIKLDSPTMTVNGIEVELPVNARLVGNKTYVPLRAVSESLNAEVLWEGETKTVKITTKKTQTPIEDKIYTEAVKDDEGKVLMNLIFTIPHISENTDSESVKKFNEHYEAVCENQVNRIKDGYSEFAAEYCAEAIAQNGKFTPVSFIYGYELSYDKFDKISIAEQITFADGINTQTEYFDTFNFDLTEGCAIDKTDILNLTEKDAQILEVYSFYLYEDNIILCLNSDNMAYYYRDGYQPSMGMQYNEETSKYFKVNIVTGDPLDYSEPEEMFEQEQSIPSELSEYKTEKFSSSEVLSARLGFKAGELVNGQGYEDIKYEAVNESISRVTYTDANSNRITVQKADGDFNITDKKNEISQKSINSVNVVFMEDENSVCACFTIDQKGQLFSYSIDMTEKNLTRLEALCSEIINRDNI